MKKLQTIGSFIEEAVVVISFSILIVINFANVVTRFLFPSISIAYTEEISLLVYMWTVLFGASICFKQKSHLGLPLLYDHMPRLGKAALTLINTACCLTAVMIMIVQTWAMAKNQIDHNLVSQATQIPLVVGGIAFPIGGVFIAIRVIGSCIVTLRSLAAEKENGEEL